MTIQNPVKERIAKLRDEIAQITEAKHLHLLRQEETTRRSRRSRRSASKIAGNSGRVRGPHRLEKL
jgi:hypothetical protein